MSAASEEAIDTAIHGEADYCESATLQRTQPRTAARAGFPTKRSGTLAPDETPTSLPAGTMNDYNSSVLEQLQAVAGECRRWGSPPVPACADPHPACSSQGRTKTPLAHAVLILGRMASRGASLLSCPVPAHAAAAQAELDVRITITECQGLVQGYRQGLAIASIFIVFAVSLAGFLTPVRS